ncbi:MAG: GNAT family N-acetyltransferase [Candidatus Saccharimonadales bacterium]
MTHGVEDLVIIEIPDPGQGDVLAEQAAMLMLQHIQGISEPTREQVQHTVTTDMDGHLSIAAIDSESSVVGTGGLSLYEADGLRAAIVNMVVAPKERGSGLGKRIISWLEEEAMRLNAKELFGQPVEAYVGFYEKLGYQPARRPYMEGGIHVKTL